MGAPDERNGVSTVGVVGDRTRQDRAIVGAEPSA
jgi:hypothetical protein